MRPDEDYQIDLIEKMEAAERLWDDDADQQRSQRVNHGMEIDDLDRDALDYQYQIDPHATA